MQQLGKQDNMVRKLWKRKERKRGENFKDID
jgi:hypothetical protein